MSSPPAAQHRGAPFAAESAPPELSPELRAELLDPEAWTQVLTTYAKTLKLAVALTDTAGRQIGACHNPQPVWLLVRNAVSEAAGCSHCLGSSPCSAVVEALRLGQVTFARDAAGLSHVAAPLFFGKQHLGALTAGQVFDLYPEPLRLRRVARDMQLSPQQLWEVAVKQRPVSAGTLHTYGGLLKTLGEAFVSQRYAVFLARDLNQRTRALAELNEELSRANEDLQQFAYSASHDLQEPLRNVTIYAQLFEQSYKGKVDAGAEEFITQLVQASRRMGMLVNDLVAYTHTATEFDPPEGPADANLALETVLEDLAGSIRDCEAVVTYSPLPPIAIKEVHLRQLFQNLIGNSLKYRLPTEPPRIHISAEERRDTCVFSVADTGIGIDSRYATLIFGLFKRLHTKEKYTGSGMGLAICKKIVERYNGHIWVESELGKGSTFRFELPTRRENND